MQEGSFLAERLLIVLQSLPMFGKAFRSEFPKLVSGQHCPVDCALKKVSYELGTFTVLRPLRISKSGPWCALFPGLNCGMLSFMLCLSALPGTVSAKY